jgi:hypothetical protein
MSFDSRCFWMGMLLFVIGAGAVVYSKTALIGKWPFIVVGMLALFVSVGLLPLSLSERRVK